MRIHKIYRKRHHKEEVEVSIPPRVRPPPRVEKSLVPASITMEAIYRAAHDRMLLRVGYKRATGERNIYLVEPYSFRGGALMAFDVDAGHIKRFNLVLEGASEGIYFTEVTDRPFEPRWPVEIAARQEGKNERRTDIPVHQRDQQGLGGLPTDRKAEVSEKGPGGVEALPENAGNEEPASEGTGPFRQD